MPVTWLILLILGAYVVGSVPSAYLAARLSHGIDIRKYGSGNVGVSNLWRMASRWLTPPVIVVDLGKGMVMVWAAQLVELGIAQQVAVGLAAIIGHNWSVFLRFNGGRGICPTLGVAVIIPLINGLIPWEIIAFCIMALIGVFIVRNVPVGIGAGIAVLPLVSWGMGRPGAITFGYLAIFLVVVIRRLTAPQTYDVTSIGKRQLLLNRLLYDRDIKDGRAWINRMPLGGRGKEKGRSQS